MSAVKIQKKKKAAVVSTEAQEQEVVIENTVQPIQNTHEVQPSPSAPQVPGNVDLGSLMMQMTQMMSQQGEMMKMMDERMKKLEENAVQPQQSSAEVAEGEVVAAINEDNVASYNREDEEGHAEIINKVWKIMYITEQAPVTRGMPDAVPMMATVEERRKVGNMTVSDTKYFPSEAAAKQYIEMARQKGIVLNGAKILSCYI